MFTAKHKSQVIEHKNYNVTKVVTLGTYPSNICNKRFNEKRGVVIKAIVIKQLAVTNKWEKEPPLRPGPGGTSNTQLPVKLQAKYHRRTYLLELTAFGKNTLFAALKL